MKLESLKSSKFDAFKSNELLSTINIVGGQRLRTIHHGSSDCLDNSTGEDIHFNDGSSYDTCYFELPAGTVIYETAEATVAAGSCCEFNEGDLVTLEFFE